MISKPKLRKSLSTVLALPMVAIFCWQIRLQQLPWWQRSIEMPLMIGRLSHTVDDSTIKTMVGNYYSMKDSPCSTKLPYFEYLFWNYLVPTEGDVGGRESVAEFIGADPCKSSFIHKINNDIAVRKVTASSKEARAAQAWLVIISKTSN